MFLTALEDFDYKPHIEHGVLVRGQVVTQTSLVWSTDFFGRVLVPAGFVTDLASLPWFASFFFKKLGKHQRAAVLHDFLYRRQHYTKSFSDEQFRRAMGQDGVARWRRDLIIAGLKLGGWYAWKNPKPVVIVE